MKKSTHRYTKLTFLILLSVLIPWTAFAGLWVQEDPYPTLNNLSAVWTTSSLSNDPWPNNVTTEIFCAGVTGTIIYNDGSGWETQNSGTSFKLNAIWGSSANNVFAVGDSSRILHYDGSSWNTQNTGAYNLNAIWGSSANNVFTVGDNGTILHTVDGCQNWESMTSGTNIKLNAVWGSSATDVFAVGELLTIVHYNGTSWSQFNITNPQEIGLNAIWGYAANSVFAVGDSGVIIWYNGDVWALLSSQISSQIDLTGIWGASACNVYAVGEENNSGIIYNFDGSTWSSQASLISPADPVPLLFGIWGNSMRDIFAVGNSGTFISLLLDESDKYPTICATSPAYGATEIALDTSIQALFSTEMAPGTITADRFTLSGGPDAVSGTITYAPGGFAVFTPDQDLDYGTTYTATISTDVEDRFGYGIDYDSDYTWSFTTTNEPSDSDSGGGGCFISAVQSGI
jgi:photosystem II stability/assembly factor-like uncharacterized protein